MENLNCLSKTRYYNMTLTVEPEKFPQYIPINPANAPV